MPNKLRWRKRNQNKLNKIEDIPVGKRNLCMVKNNLNFNIDQFLV